MFILTKQPVNQSIYGLFQLFYIAEIILQQEFLLFRFQPLGHLQPQELQL